jgi:hypothetical protein
MSANGPLDDDLHLQEAIRSGKLPNRSPERTWAGRSCGVPCAICGQRINPDELEYELEFAPGDDSEQPEGHHLHIGCFWAWETERQKPQSKRGTERAIGLSGEVVETRLADDDRQTSGSRGRA